MSWFGAVWAVLASGFSLLVWWRLRAARAVPDVSPPPRVLLLRPVDAPSAQELANLGAPLDYPGEVEQYVISPYCPRLPPEVRWLYSDPTAPNRKVGHLLHALASLDAQGRVVLCVDADVRVTGALISSLASAVARGAALVASAPVVVAGTGLGTTAFRALLGHTHLSFLAQSVAPAGAPAICGKAVALGTLAQEELKALSAVVGEDLELSARVVAVGGRVAHASVPAEIHDGHRTLPRAIERGIRWLQVARAHRPALFFTIPLFLAPTVPLLLWALLAQDAPLSLAVAFLITTRVLLSWRLGTSLGVEHSPVAWLAGELLLLVSFGGAVLNPRTIAWRDRVLVLGRDGTIARSFSTYALQEPGSRGG